MLRKKTVRLGYYVIACVALLMGCDSNGEEEIDYRTIDQIRFSEHVQRLLGDRCTSCHAGAQAEAGLLLDTWAHITAGSSFGEALIPFDADNSRLVEMASKRSPAHPADVGATALTADELDFLRRWIDEGGRNDAGEVPFETSTNLLYVCNQDDATISIIDMTANVVVRTVKLEALGFSATAKPHHVVVEPDGSFWYVSLISENTVLKFSSDNELVDQVDFFETPGMLALHPTEDLLFAGRSLSAPNPPTAIGFIRRSDMTAEEVPVVFPRPHALAVNPAGTFVFSASLSENQLIAVNIATKEATFTAVEGDIQAFVQHTVSPDGTTMYSSSQLTSHMRVFDISDPLNITLTGNIEVNAAPWHPLYATDGSVVHVGNKDANTVTALDTFIGDVLDVISGDGLAEPHGIAQSPNGRFIYVSNRNTRGAYTPRHDFGDNANDGTVVVIERPSNTIVKVLEVGRFAAGMNTR